MKLLIMQFPPISRYFISLGSRYSPQHSARKKMCPLIFNFKSWCFFFFVLQMFILYRSCSEAWLVPDTFSEALLFTVC
jgi:hypothetical protein